MSVLDGFYTTWNNARETFGQGTPQPGTDFDNSSKLRDLGSNVDNAKPGSWWSGSAASGYEKANDDHKQVFGKLAELDQKLAEKVNQSAQVVENGRQNLDSVKQWVTDAANSVPPGKQRDMFLMQIANKGLGQLSDVVKQSNDELSGVGNGIRGLKGGYDEAGDQKHAKGDGEKKPGDEDAQALGSEEEKKAEEEARKQAEKDVHDALAGDQAAAGRVEDAIGDIVPGKTLTPEQQSYLSQMQAQQHGMSVEDLKTAEQRLGEHKDIIGDSWQLMSNDDVYFPRTPTDHVGALDDPSTVAKGGFDQLPQSVQQALNRDGIDNPWDKVTDPLGPRTDNARDVSAIADIVRDGDQNLQTGTKLDDAMLDWSRETLHDQQGPSIFESLGLSHDYADYASARDDALADVFNSAGRDHQAVSAELGSDTGQQFLTDLHTHVWAETPNMSDNQASTHSLLSWIGDEANSSNPEVATRAGVAAHALAVNLDANHELYVNPPESPYGPVPNAANLNPALIGADALALTPYQNALVGDMRGIQGFEVMGDPAGGHVDHARNIFSVIDSDPGAAKLFNAAAENRVIDHQHAFADAVKNNTGPAIGDTRTNDMRSASLLLGAVNGGAEMEASARGLQGAQLDQAVYDVKKAGIDSLFGAMPGKDFIPGWDMTRDTIAAGILGPSPEPGHPVPNVATETAQHAVNTMSYQVADALDVRVGDPDIDARFFDTDGNLLPPEQVPLSDRYEYTGSLQNYLTKHGYGGVNNDITDYYNQGAGK